MRRRLRNGPLRCSRDRAILSKAEDIDILRRAKLIPAALLALLAIVCTAATSSSTRASSSPQDTVRAYIAAINAKDGQKLCDLLHPVEARAISYYFPTIYARPGHKIKPSPCRWIAAAIGSGGATDNAPRWRHAAIVHMDAPKKGDHGVISIDVQMRDSWERGGPSKETRTTTFYLVRYDGRYVIVRRSSLLNQAISSEPGVLSDMPPATREPRAEDVKMPVSTSGCGAPTWTGSDPKGDDYTAHAPWLDLRNVSVEDSETKCVTLQFEAPLMPGTFIELLLHGGFGPQVYIFGNGDVYYDSYSDNTHPVAGTDYGLIGDRTLVLRFKPFSDEPLDRNALVVVVTPLSLSEPLIHTQPPFLGGDQFGE